MTGFLIAAVVMTALALAWVLPPLLRRRGADAGVARTASNLAVLRDQLAELDADLESGTIGPDQHVHARAELERRVLTEAADEPAAGAGGRGGRWAALAIGVMIPVFAALFYLQTGTPGALVPESDHGDASISPAEVEQMVSRLAARLESNPADAEGWALLARSYYALGRHGEAVKSYAKAVELNAGNAGLYADYADALAMSRGRRLDGDVVALIDKALAIDPAHIKALVLAGTAAFERQDYAGAVTYLERLQRQLPPQTELAGMVTERLEQARARAGGKGAAQDAAKDAAPAPASGATIKVRVSVAPALAGKVAPADTVFILARAPEGSRMPIAIVKRQGKDLPAEFTLSDEQAMAPQMKLSGFSEVVIVARVSKSGNAAPRSGDLQGATGTVKVGAAGVQIVIDTIVP